MSYGSVLFLFFNFIKELSLFHSSLALLDYRKSDRRTKYLMMLWCVMLGHQNTEPCTTLNMTALRVGSCPLWSVILVSHHVVVGNCTQDLLKNNQCSSPLSHFSSPVSCTCNPSSLPCLCLLFLLQHVWWFSWPRSCWKHSLFLEINVERHKFLKKQLLQRCSGPLITMVIACSCLKSTHHLI